jgi:hypothetical protein
MLTGLCQTTGSKAVGSIKKESYAVFSIAVIQCSSASVFGQMTKGVPGIRPAVISTETGTRLDEYRRFRHVVRNVYTHRFDPAKLGKLVNSAPELFARTKAELLAFAAFLEH